VKPDHSLHRIELTIGERRRAHLSLIIGAILLIVGLVVELVIASRLGPSEQLTLADLAANLKLLMINLAATVVMIAGVVQIVGAIFTLFPPTPRSAIGSVMPTLGYRTFVAWRYLLVWPVRVRKLVPIIFFSALAVRALCYWIAVEVLGHDPSMFMRIGTSGLATPLWVVEQLAAWVGFAAIYCGMVRFSKPVTWVFLILAGLSIACVFLSGMIVNGWIPFLDLSGEQMVSVLEVLWWARLILAVFAGIALLAGFVRSLFTFFTTVPIVGVTIGVSALVMVLSVMSGFESDLRQKILGSNAHIQITRETGEFTEWREVKARVDKIPGIEASTPFATSEVVIAANNSGMNVIIKGIDPATVAKVTDLVHDIEGDDKDKLEAMKRLAPLVDDNHDLKVPQKPPTKKPKVDPPPADMPQSGDPIDFSGEGSASGGGSDSPYGGDARPLLDIPDPNPNEPNPTSGAIIDDRPPPAPPPTVVDPPPADLLQSDDPPADYSVPDAELPIHVVDAPLDPSMSRRTQSLPGILVGRELVKQTHLYTGEEVRIVSPLSDPSNPDATGTPIPFNRDYRVAGIFYTGMYEYDLKYVYVSLDSLQEFLDRGDAVDGIELRIEHPDDTDSIVDTLSEQLGPNYRVQDWKELNRSLFSALKLEKIVMFAVLGIVILVAAFAIMGNLIMTVVEKAREIGLLKTLGATDLDIVQLFATQGLLIGLVGTLIGVGLGLLGCWYGMSSGVNLNPDVYYIDKLPIHIEASSVCAAAATGILVSLAFAIIPAAMSARVRPSEALRH
jgi:lipoprotein-releasing system permease protein